MSPRSFTIEHPRFVSGSILRDVFGVEAHDAWSPTNDVTAGSSTPIGEQFARLRELGAGWNGEGSVALDRGALEGLERFLAAALPRTQLPTPYVYATPEGGGCAEWSLPSWELAVESVPESRAIQLHATSLTSDRIDERELPLDTAGFEDFAAFVAGLRG